MSTSSTLTINEVIAILDRTIAHAERLADGAETALRRLDPTRDATAAMLRHEHMLGRLHGLKEARELLERTIFDPAPEPEPASVWPCAGLVDGATVLVGTYAEVGRWLENLPPAYRGRATIRPLSRPAEVR